MVWRFVRGRSVMVWRRSVTFYILRLGQCSLDKHIITCRRYIFQNKRSVNFSKQLIWSAHDDHLFRIPVNQIVIWSRSWKRKKVPNLINNQKLLVLNFLPKRAYCMLHTVCYILYATYCMLHTVCCIHKSERSSTLKKNVHF